MVGWVARAGELSLSGPEVSAGAWKSHITHLLGQSDGVRAMGVRAVGVGGGEGRGQGGVRVGEGVKEPLTPPQHMCLRGVFVHRPSTQIHFYAYDCTL